MADKYLQRKSGAAYAVENELLTSSAGAGDSGKGIALDAAGRLDTSFMPVGVAADTASIQASDNLAAGDFVNIWNDSSNFRVRKADASSPTTRAHGFVLAGVTSGQNATVYFEGSNTQVTGLTAGDVYLSTTPGEVTQTAPTGTGEIAQQLGVSTSATVVNTEISQPIELA
jgi:hypothetical protein